MFFGLMLSSILIAAQEPAMQANACSAVNQMKGKPVPATSSEPQGSIVHGALLYFGDAFAGTLYGTAGGNVWYQGAGKSSPAISDAARSRANAMLGISNNASGTLVAAPKPNFADALAPDVKLRGCF